MSTISIFAEEEKEANMDMAMFNGISNNNSSHSVNSNNSNSHSVNNHSSHSVNNNSSHSVSHHSATASHNSVEKRDRVSEYQEESAENQVILFLVGLRA